MSDRPRIATGRGMAREPGIAHRPRIARGIKLRLLAAALALVAGGAAVVVAIVLVRDVLA